MNDNQNLNSTSNNTQSNPDIEHFKRTLRNAIGMMVVVIAVIAGLGFWKDANIVFVTPLKINTFQDECAASQEPSMDDTQTLVRCYEIKYATNPDAQKQPHPYSILAVIKIVTTGLVLYITGRNYMGLPIEPNTENKSKHLLEKITIFLRNAALGVSLALFSIIIFSALEIMAGLIAIDESPLFIKYGIALLTVSVFVSVITFILIEWLRDMRLTDIGRAGVVILIVSYSLSIPFTTHNWNTAYSALGSTNNSALVAGGNGSEYLFRFTMVALGLIFMAFTIDLLRLFIAYFKEMPDVQARKLWVRVITGLSGFIAGFGSMIVGFYPTDSHWMIHVAGVALAIGASVVLVSVLLWSYPVSTRNASNRSSLYKTLSATAILGFTVIILVALVAWQVPNILVLEFAYFFFFLIFIQIYSTYLQEYIEDEPEIRVVEDYKQYREYLIPKQATQAIQNIGQKTSPQEPES